ncbi:MAG: hypothetical protein ACK4Q5_19030 [Saprospiraceae bacterium]
MKKTALRALFLAATLSVFFACKNEQPAQPAAKDEAPSIGLEKSWLMDVASTKNLPAMGKGSPAQQRMNEGFYTEKARTGFSWHLFPGGTAAELRNQKYQTGTWASTDGNKTFTLTFADGKPETVTVKHLGADSMLVSVGEGKIASEIAFKSDGARYDAPEQNPYHPSNNLWRIKPAAAETDAQLRARLRNHLHHMGLILEAGIKHKMKVVSFRGSPSCLHQYNSAIGMETESQIPQAWYDCFYDKNDAKKAYKMLEQEMRSNGKPPTDAKKPWVENNLIIFQHLEAGFQN